MEEMKRQDAGQPTIRVIRGDPSRGHTTCDCGKTISRNTKYGTCFACQQELEKTLPKGTHAK